MVIINVFVCKKCERAIADLQPKRQAKSESILRRDGILFAPGQDDSRATHRSSYDRLTNGDWS
jgi:hypothetical protein